MTAEMVDRQGMTVMAQKPPRPLGPHPDSRGGLGDCLHVVEQPGFEGWPERPVAGAVWSVPLVLRGGDAVQDHGGEAQNGSGSRPAWRDEKLTDLVHDEGGDLTTAGQLIGISAKRVSQVPGKAPGVRLSLIVARAEQLVEQGV